MPSIWVGELMLGNWTDELVHDNWMNELMPGNWADEHIWAGELIPDN